VANRKSKPLNWYATNYAIIDLWVNKLLAWSDLKITIDAFANKSNRRFKRFWSLKSDAFTKKWSKEILWCNPPFHLIQDMIQKIIDDKARALLILPHWPHLRWWKLLEKISIKWWDLPHDVPLYQSDEGIIYKRQLPRTTTRAIVVDGSTFSDLNNIESYINESFSDNFNIYSYSSFTSDPIISHTSCDDPLDLLDISEIDYDLSEKPIQSQTMNTHPNSDLARTRLRADHKYVLEEFAIFTNPEHLPPVRGPYGECHIEVSDLSKLTKSRPYRLIGERETALRDIIADHLTLGILEPCTKSNNSSPAFVVPKQILDPLAPTRYRLVVDYRQLNEHTVIDPEPIPIIEDMLARQAHNQIWSILDLKHGFHQIPMRESDRHLTAFVTPDGSYQYRCMPMGIKNAPAILSENP
jgi:hypothetical protein